ncbi:MAG: hypothetical protein HUU06_08035, partial [Planctomycetaceae bacterium]|nr:hypothetical protein [Planctomycetaceae bacterium]
MRKGVLALAILLAGAYSGTAFAHGVGVEGLDLSALQDLATDRAAETPVSEKKARKAWVKLASTLAKEGKKGLADDAKKLSVVLKLVEGPFASDLELAEALDEAVAALDGTLSDLPGESEKWIDHVESEKDRAAVAKLSIAARGHHLEGRTLGNGGDGKGRLASFRKSALGFLKTWGRADKAIDRQGGPLPVEVAAEAGKIYTVVGTGTGGFNGDGREARRSSLYWVEEVKFGPDGRLYILDWNNHMVRRLEADGTVSRLFGKGVPGDSEGTPEDTELNHPSSIDFGPDGRIFVGAWHNHKVKVYDPNGGTPTVYTIAGTIQGNSGDGASAAQAKFNLLPGVLLLPPDHPFGGGDLLCTDAGNQCVRIVKLASDPLTDTNVAGVSVPTGKVERFWGTGVQGHDGNGGQASAARLGFSKAQNAESDGRMTMDAAGNVFLVNGVENVIRRIALDGTITIVAGTGEAGYSGDGGPATSAKLNFPSDVAVAPDGTLFISDQLNNVVRKVTPGGTISTFVGDGTGASGY